MTFCLLLLTSLQSTVRPMMVVDSAVVSVTVAPDRVLIARGEGSRYLNFDFHLENEGNDTLLINTIQVSVFDASNALVLRRAINRNGLSPSIHVIPFTQLAPGASIAVFNPFHTFDHGVPLDVMEYEFFLDAPGEATHYRSTVRVAPVEYETKTHLRLPVEGRVLVVDGNDFYAHHRRVPLTDPVPMQFGIEANSARYAYDLSVVRDGELYDGFGEENEEWFGFGATLVAPGAGRIVEIQNDVPDNRPWIPELDYARALDDLRFFYGNYVVIDHLNGEFSYLMHMKEGSIRVKPGQIVEQEEELGQLGNSGDSYLPHLHYQLQTGRSSSSEGLPIYFRDYRRTRGTRVEHLDRGFVETGDIVERR